MHPGHILAYMSQGLGIYCLAVEVGFYSDVVEWLPVDPATWVRLPSGTGKIFSLLDNGAHCKKPIIGRYLLKYLPWSHFTCFLYQEIQGRISNSRGCMSRGLGIYKYTSTALR